MKKSFIMTVAVSMALSAVATETGYISGTSFEDISLGEKSSVELVKDANDAGVVDNVCYWSTDAWETENSADYEGFFVVTNISGDTSYPESRPEYWNGKANSNALVIDTDKPLDRFIHDPENGGISSESLKDTNVFFDSVVQFTATDVSPTPVSSIDKLLVWLYTSPEDVTETNRGLFNETTPITTLVVTAGYYKENDSTLYTTNYCVAADNVSIEPDEWHRLTIKAFTSNDGEHALFNVYVDGKKVKTEDEMSDFISLKDNLTSIPDIIGVAFDGKGMVDDIAFTTKAPEFAKDSEEDTTTNFAISFSDMSAISKDHSAWLYVVNKSAEYEIITDTTNIVLHVGDTAKFEFGLSDAHELVSPTGVTLTEDGDGYNVYSITIDALPAEGATIEIVTKPASGGGDDVTYPTVKPNGTTTTEVTLSPEAKAVIKAAFTDSNGYDAPETLTVIVNGEEYFGDKAVNMINSVAQMFNGNPFDADGKLEIVFKVTDVRIAEGATGGYTLTVGAATLKDAYEVAPDYIDLASGQSDPNGKPTDGSPVIFKLVVKEKAPTTTP